MPPRNQPPASLQYRRAPEAPAPTVANEPEGVVVAVVSVTGTVDEVGDLIVPGAYARTLAERLPKVIKEHQWPERIGRVLHIEELMPGDSRLPKTTGRGAPWPREAGALIATIQFNLNTDLGRDEFENVRFYGAEQQWSIGYKVVPMKTRRRRDGVRVIGDLDLWEISSVLWGAHLDTLALQVKSARQDAAKADKELRDAVDTEITATREGDADEASKAAGDAADAEKAAAKADETETGLVAEQAVALDMADTASGVAARKRAAQKLRAAARARARRAKDEATLTEMDRRDEWDRAIELETLEEQKRRSEYRRKYKLTRADRNRRVDLAEDERVRRATWTAQMKRWVRVEKARRRKWSMSMRARSDAVASAIRSIEAKSAADLVAEVKGLPKKQKCHYCKAQATKRIIHAEGMAYIPVCGKHLKKGRYDASHSTPDGSYDPSNINRVDDIETKGGVPGVADTPEDLQATRRLFRWYEKGEGAALIQWGVDGDFYRCVAIAGKHMTAENAKGFCANRHKGALGTWPGDHDGDGKRDKKSAPADGMEWKTMTEMRGSFEERRRKLEQAVDAVFCPKPTDAGDGMVAAGGWASIDATFDTRLYVTVYKDGSQESYEIPYSFDAEGEVTLGEPTEVELTVVARPEVGMEPEPVDGDMAAQMRYLTPVLTGYGELAVATKTAVLGLETKGGDGWKSAIADAVRTLVSAAEEAGISLDDPDEPDLGDDGFDADGTESDAGDVDDEGVPYEDTEPVDDEAGDAGDMDMPGMGRDAGFGVLGDDAPAPDDGGGGEATDDGGEMDAPMAPAEPGVPDDDMDMPAATDGDADDDGETDGVESADAGAPADDPAASGDPTAETAEAGDTYADNTDDMDADADTTDTDADTDTDEDEDDEDEDGKPWKKGETKTLTLDPADVIAQLEALRRASS